MSGKPEQLAPIEGGDRRARKTKTALVGAFARLVHGRRYDHIRIKDILEQANVGRSTFYEHYRGKDDLLIKSMAPLLDILASVATQECELARVERLLDHFYERHQAAYDFFAGPSMRAQQAQAARELAQRIEQAWMRGEWPQFPDPKGAVDPKTTVAGLPLDLIATQTAESILAWVKSGLASREAHLSAHLARCMRRSVLGGLRALLAD